MAFFKKKETKEAAPEQVVSRNTREIEGLEEAFKTEPEEKEAAVEAAPLKSLLEDKYGVYKSIRITELSFSKSAVPTDEIIVRKKGDKYELIGVGNIEVKVIEGSDQEISLMRLDHLVKHDLIPEEKKLEIYKYEMKNSELIQTLTGRSPAELNGVTDDYFASMVVRDNVDAKLRSLPTAAVIEAAKLPKDVQKILGEIVAQIGPSKITENSIKALNGVKADKAAILMRLLEA